MDNAEALFQKLDLTYVQTEMIGKEFESNWLECKEKQKPDQGTIEQGDKSNFAKALSGFANTSGGVLIFGLEARKDKDDIDQIVAIKAIKELKRFESSLREMESRIVERLVPKVEYKRIETNSDEGLMAVYVPQSPYVPHRSQMDSKFYLRAGGIFSPMSLTLIEDLFARRLRPALEFVVRALPNDEFLVCLVNKGEATAKNPFVVFALAPDLRHTGYELDGNNRLHSWLEIPRYKDTEGTHMSFQNGSRTAVHPGSEVPLIKLRRHRVEQSGRMGSSSTWTFPYYIYAEDMPPKDGICEIKIRR